MLEIAGHEITVVLPLLLAVTDRPMAVLLALEPEDMHVRLSLARGSAGGRLQGLVEVLDDVIDMLDADA